jgi:hypothetical protein
MLKYLNPINWFYFLKGHFKTKVQKTYTQKELIMVSNRSAQCPICVKNIDCVNCGCPTLELFLSGKPCKNSVTALILLFCTSVFAQLNYVETIVVKDSKILISAPHGGTLKPAALSNRIGNGIKVKEDVFTLQIAKELQKKLKCNLVYTNLHRSKLDFNRPSDEATGNDDRKFAIWTRYHYFINEQVFKNVTLVIDIHGHTHKEGLIEIGGIESDCLVFGNLLNKYYPAYPSNAHIKPELYFTGGFITKIIYNKENHIQIELPIYLRTKKQLKALTDNLVKVILEYQKLK